MRLKTPLTPEQARIMHGALEIHEGRIWEDIDPEDFGYPYGTSYDDVDSTELEGKVQEVDRNWVSLVGRVPCDIWWNMRPGIFQIR